LARLAEALPDADFSAHLASAGRAAGLTRRAVEVFQINLGKLCNLSCRHCHVDAGPHRVAENMDRATAEACVAALARSAAHTVDLTGGAPELNPNFRWLVAEARRLGRHVIDRCNLTVLLLPRFEDLPEWLGAQGVEVVASLPHPRRPYTDAQRGEGTYDRSITAIQRLNAAGYGQGDPSRRLTLVHNPAGAWLPSGQAALEADWRRTLARTHGIHFDRLIALTNMPVSRYLEWLCASENVAPYLRRLVDAFNPAAVDGLMCRNTVSIGWDGTVYDCDFNQMLELPASPARHVSQLDTAALTGAAVRTDRHCYGCTAGAGSGCGGALT